MKDDLPTGTILRYDESKSSHGVTLSIDQFVEWGVLVPVTDERLSRAEWEATIDYEAATEMLIVETGMWSKPELFVIAKAHATNIVHAALGGNDEG